MGLAWQGNNEFTIGNPGPGAGYDAACIYDGKEVSSCSTYTFEKAIDETSVLTVTVENTGFNINKTNSWGWSQALTYDCTGTWCKSLGTFPCEMDIGMRYDEY